MVNSDLDDRPLDRALFAAFAELVRTGGNGPVADVGCGSGRVTILLSRLGLDAFGVDLSPGMVSLARRNYPQLREPPPHQTPPANCSPTSSPTSPRDPFLGFIFFVLEAV